MQHPIQIDAAGGEYMEDVVILEWGAALGDKVSAGDVIVTVETAKAATEIEAPADGYLVEIRFAVGDEAPVGERLGTIADSLSEFSETAAPEPTSDAPAAVPPVPAGAAASGSSSRAEALAALQVGRVRATPLARRLAAQKGVDLTQVTGTGPRGRIKSADVSRAVETVAIPMAPAVRLGEALPIVLIHGFADDKSGWRALKPLLERGHRIVTPELPGHGSASPTEVKSLEDMAFAVTDQLRAEGIEEAHLVGHSLGGAVAVLMADLGLVQARSLGLIAPGGMGAQANTAFVNGLADAETPEALTPWFETMVADASVLPAGLARAALRQRERTGNGPALKAMAKTLFGNGTQMQIVRPRLERLDMPIRVLWGLSDAVLPASQADALPAQVALHRLPGTGHVPQLEAPQLTARLLNELIRSAD